MPDVKLGQEWDIFSTKVRRWQRAVVTHIDGDRITLLYVHKEHALFMRSDCADL
jgi:hypothetical protein